MTDLGFLESTREGYDLTAAGYAERFHNHLHDRPLDRAMLTGFAGLVERGGVVADVGCGGAASRLLTDLDLGVLGIDLSPNMIAEARRLNPDLKFQVGSMTELAFDDGHFHAICAWYSVIHIPDELLPDVFSEFRRVLRPGGWALVAFQVGEQPREFKQMFGEQVSLTSRVSDRPPNVSLCSTFQRNVAHTFTFDVRRRQPTACARASRGDVTALRRSRT